MNVIFWMSNGFDTHFTSEHLLKAVIKALVGDGHSVHVIQMDQGGGGPALPEDIALPGVTTGRVPYAAPQKNSFVKRYLSEVRWHLACGDELRKHKDYDALFLQSTTVGGFALGLARRVLGKKAKLTFNVQDIFPNNAAFSGKLQIGGPAYTALSAVQRSAYRQADHLITISEDMKDTLTAEGVPAEKVEVVYNWSYQDEVYEDVDLAPVAHMFAPDLFNVVYAGNIGVMQNVDILVEAAKLMKNDSSVQFHIIGNGVYKDKLAAKAKEYGLTNLSFWPMQPPETAPLIYSAADVNVIPLVKDVFRTALPSKTATCLACRKPIIFAIGRESRFGREVSRETGCPVVDADDAAALVEAIRAVRGKRVSVDTGAYYLKAFQKSRNSRKYAQIITS